jgi:hypothetical protein
VTGEWDEEVFRRDERVILAASVMEPNRTISASTATARDVIDRAERSLPDAAARALRRYEVAVYVMAAAVLALDVGALAGRMVAAFGGGLAVAVQATVTAAVALSAGYFSESVMRWLGRRATDPGGEP